MQNRWPVCNSRLSLTSQMGCNCLINPMFVGFYAFSYGLFSLRAVSSADSPSLGECLCQKHLLPHQRYFAWDVESYCLCCLSWPAPPMEGSGAALSSTPVGRAAAVSSCLLRCHIVNAAPLSSMQKLTLFFAALNNVI